MLNDPDSGGRGWGAKTAFMFAILGAICVAVIYLAIPDYTGRSFAQIDELFYRRVPARQWKKDVCTSS
jgi:hypothetical protein